MSHHHAVAWIDHHEARVFQFEGDGVHSEVVKAHSNGHKHGHRIRQSDHAEADMNFFAAVAKDLSKANEILVVGPGSAKLEFMRYAHKHAPQVEKSVLSVETVDHPTDKQLIAHARKFFIAADQMQGNV